MTVEQEVEAFFVKHRKMALSDKQVLLSPEDTPDGIYYIQKGQVRQYDIAENGDEIVVNVMRVGSHFPMNWIITNERNMWYYEAIGETTLYVAPADETLIFLQENQNALFAYVKRLCSGATGQQRRMAHLMGGSARSRVLYELIVEFKRFGKADAKGSAIEISETELASKAGLSREAVNRELTRLKQEGLITRKYKKICAVDYTRLEDILGSTI